LSRKLFLVEFGRLAFRDGDAERLLQELARLQAVASGLSLGLHGRLAARRDHDFDDARHVRRLLDVN
jgi:hypothetical protein